MVEPESVEKVVPLAVNVLTVMVEAERVMVWSVDAWIVEGWSVSVRSVVKKASVPWRLEIVAVELT